MNRRSNLLDSFWLPADRRRSKSAAALLALVVLLPLLLLAARSNPAAAASPSSELTAAEWAQIQSQIAPRADDPWSEAQKLTANDEADNGIFGYAVTVDGDTAIVGSPQIDGDKGAAYVFTRTNGTWNLEQKLVSSDLAATDYLGNAVALEGDTAVIGAFFKQGLMGAVYVFTRSAGVWTEQQKLTAADPASADVFGYSVAISGSTVAIGARGDDVGSGSVYVFVTDGTTWTQQQKLVANDAASYGYFGSAIALEGNMLLVGAPGTSSDTGAVYAFTRSGTTWTQQQKLVAADTTTGDKIGSSVAMSGDLAVFGAPEKASKTGAAYLFNHDGTNWTEAATLTASDGAPSRSFGISSATDGTTIVVGDSAFNAAYVFTSSEARADAAWAEEQKLTVNDSGNSDYFARSVAVDGTTVFVGAFGHNTNRGAVYVFGSAGGDDGGGDDTVPGAFVSTAAAGKIGKLKYGPNDILRYDGTTWTKWFDSAAAGLTTPKQARFNVDSLWVSDADAGAAVMSFLQSGIVIPGITGKVDGTDLVQWDGSAFSLWFEGEDVGLDNEAKERIDGLHVLAKAPAWSEFSGDTCEAYLLISTVSQGVVPKPGNPKPLNKLAFNGEDILGFCATSLGTAAAGKWELAFDGSEYNVKFNEMNSISASADGRTLYLVSKGKFTIGATVVKPFSVFSFDVGTETFSGPILTASGAGLPRRAKIDGLNLLETAPAPVR